ncbi:MAG: hypothetical protein IKL16_05180 [Clostridia bacterium]|nr:hypothetical protein [Clostridia bacterium]
MKKIIAILMAGIMLLSFAACGGNGNEEETTTGETTVAETTTSPMVNADTRFSHKATMNVWTNGKKVAYESGATKIMTATATLNDSVIYDTLTVTDTKADFKAMKKASCVEITYEKDQVASFSGKKVTYDQIIVATSGEGVPLNTIFFLKDGATAGAPIAVKAAEGRKTLSENLTTAVEVITHEGHTH